MSRSLIEYLKEIEKNLENGNATEHTHRSALKKLLESLGLECLTSISVTNEPKRIDCGSPDFIISCNQLTIGYVEAKDVGKSLIDVEDTDQIKRYLRAINNLILTDYLDFRWYVNGALRQEARLAKFRSKGKLKTEKDGHIEVKALLQNFLQHQPENINSPKELAERMARLTHIIRDIIVAAFETEQASQPLKDWREAFAKVLIADLGLPEKTPDFADMFAQTLAYGLFTARVMDTSMATFTRQRAQFLIPKSNPFLRDFFMGITSPKLDDEQFASFVDDLVNLLAHTDMAAVLSDFGRRTRQEDPVVHFYETFLTAYDPKLREARGVYYTPEPVVSYIVRSVDVLLKNHFNCPQGLADSSKITVTVPDSNSNPQSPKTTVVESHKVLVLDPATGTGTFLYAVIDHIRQQFMQQGNAGMWSSYVKNHLLSRLVGFELLMAPYAVAHFKLSLQLAGRDLADPLAKQWAYHPEEKERLSIYLTNTLQEPHEMLNQPLFTQWVANETNAANEIKQDLPVLIVMGNPPYSGHSANKSDWIDNLLKGNLPDGSKTSSYYNVDGRPLGERNSKWLQDDYVKFIRFGQWRIEKSGHGILAFISNNGYLDNPTFRGMRQSLMGTFNEIYLLNLHGSIKKKETTPDGGKDENVFDIMQGVNIGIFVRQPNNKEPAKVYYADLWGTRTYKYEQLFEQDVSTTSWTELKPQSDLYLFSPQNTELLDEYNLGWKVNDIFPITLIGPNSHRDAFAITFDYDTANERIKALSNQNISNEEIENLYNIKDTRDWSINSARKLKNLNEQIPIKCMYRPFDFRFMLYGEYAFDYHRPEINDNLLINNFALISTRQTKEAFAILTTDLPVGQHKLVTPYDGSYISPLYIYPTKSKQNRMFDDISIWPKDQHNSGRVPNFNPKFITEFEKKLNLSFTPHMSGDLQTTFGSEDIFYYTYAIFYSPTYRIRYAEFLKLDFPRVPFTSDVKLFFAFCELGKKMVNLHLLKSLEIKKLITCYPHSGDNRIEKRYPIYTPPSGEHLGRVYINKTQYIEGILPEIWEFHIGGYQVLEKWLKDRRGRQLSYDDLTHYQQMVVVLQKTIELMEEIDNVITEWPIQ